MTDSNGALNEQQLAFVRHYVACLNAQQAAQQAAYSPSYCRKASKLLRHSRIKAAIEDSQAALRKSQGYSALQAVAEIDRQIKGALGSKNPNHMAAAKLLELKCKIYGLIKEKVEVVRVDLSGSLARAAQRVMEINPAYKHLLHADQSVMDGDATTAPPAMVSERTL